MSRRLQVVLPDDLAAAVQRAAEKEGRSVSQWLRRLIEAELAGERTAREASPPGRAPVKQQRPVLAPKGDCPHPDLGEKRQTSFGFARDCKVCGEVVKV